MSDSVYGLENIIREKDAVIERLQAALKLFVRCAYPVAKEINPRGYDWMPEKSLDYALEEARKALAVAQQASHEYVPSLTAAHMGECIHCGHLQDDPIHRHR